MNSFNIRLGYVFVVNGVGNETNEEAQKKEKVLFKSHPKLKKIEKSIVEILVLAKKLMQFQGRKNRQIIVDGCEENCLHVLLMESGADQYPIAFVQSRRGQRSILQVVEINGGVS
jgi:hypothetical protein